MHQYDALWQIPSTSDPKLIYDELKMLTSADISWLPPGDDAEYIVQIIIGDVYKASCISIIFSRWSNLCLVEVLGDPGVKKEIIDNALISRGWVIVPIEDQHMIIFPSKQTVAESFFGLI